MRPLLGGTPSRADPRSRGPSRHSKVQWMWEVRQPARVLRCGPRRPQERLLGDVQGVCGGGELTGQEKQWRLPPGYRLDRSNPDVWALRRPEGWVVANFSARGATKDAVERTAWEDHEGAGEEEYP